MRGLLQQPASVVAELRNWLKRMGIAPRADSDRDIIDFLNPGLRHHVYSADRPERRQQDRKMD